MVRVVRVGVGSVRRGHHRGQCEHTHIEPGTQRRRRETAWRGPSFGSEQRRGSKAVRQTQIVHTHTTRTRSKVWG